MIGGGSRRLGSPNLPFARKLKLLKAIPGLNADYVIIDLGGDTAYNVLDFFLLADHRLVLTSCDPASYLDAYTFVKMALHRRLSRLFGQESIYRNSKDDELFSLIQQHIGPEASPNNGPANTIPDLIQAVSQEAPTQEHLLRNAIGQFQPRLIVNMVHDPEEVGPLVSRFQNVARRMLSIDVAFAGSIPAERHIARSTHDLTPEVARHPQGSLANFLAHLSTLL